MEGWKLATETTDDEMQAATLKSITDVQEAIDKLQRALETSMFYGSPGTIAQQNLKDVLGKLGIKSARHYSGGLQMEDLEATMKQVEFNVDKLKLWKDIK